MENTKENDKLPEIFAADVFCDRELEKMIPSSSFKVIKECRRVGRQIPENIADQIANAMKEWAMSRGATHFTHWFQPMTGLTAEKHDAFLQTTMSDDHLLLRFSGKELIKGEPDASSFPSGGIRSTFEARGYTAWDMTSPAFIRKRRNGSVLYIPTCFCSWTGEALDKKTPLLRSQEVLSREATRLLHILGNNDVHTITPTLGVEQEFFLIDRGFYLKRPDLIACGRTLLGAKPSKGQELEDHYFGSMNTRILACIQELEWELWRLGVPTKTRHNEVAPGQYEIAPIFEHASLASDHNMLTMQLLKDIAPRHGLECLLHEKPFAGVNGSGKHCNWSMSTNEGENLLEPGKTPARNAQFMVFLSAVIRAVDLYADLLRISIVTPGNDYRLGANEAPPAIISIYLGRELDSVCQDIIRDDAPNDEPEPTIESPASASSSKMAMKLGVTSLPNFPRDSTDRNRTSPFAFTGNKFEFRAVGSSQTVSRPVMMLNTIIAESIRYMSETIEKQLRGGVTLTQAIQNVVRDTLRRHYRIVFNGNGYSEDWVVEAAKRGLPNYKTAPDALAEFLVEKNVRLFAEFGVLSQSEVVAHRNIMYENYVKALSIEAAALHNIASTFILPACINAQGKIAKSVKNTMDLLGEKPVEGQKEYVKQIASRIQELIQSIEDLKKEIDEGVKLHHHSEDESDPLQTAVLHSNRNIMSSMKKCRHACDSLELIIENSVWPLPTYAEMLLLR